MRSVLIKAQCRRSVHIWIHCYSKSMIMAIIFVLQCIQIHKVAKYRNKCGNILILYRTYSKYVLLFSVCSSSSSSSSYIITLSIAVLLSFAFVLMFKLPINGAAKLLLERAWWWLWFELLVIGRGADGIDTFDWWWSKLNAMFQLCNETSFEKNTWVENWKSAP